MTKDRAHTKDLTEHILHGSAYRLAHEDLEFLAEDDLRPVRLQLELVKPERALRHHDIHSTVVIFGSARIGSPDIAEKQLEEARQLHRRDLASKRQLLTAERRVHWSRYYEEARRFSELVSRQFQRAGRRDFVVVTGGGPGVMEAANRGALDVGARSAGLNVTLPSEQRPNPFITPDLAFRFRYFAIRKMHFLIRAKALVAFPGGYGTLDEVFEVLTLVQTRKMQSLPIILFGREFWNRAIDFDFLVDEGMIPPQDRALFCFVETAEQAVSVLKEFYGGHPPDEPMIVQGHDMKGDR
ncbi:LOG family protein [uncultured Marivita sp.]|uniref:LOG family protein n=1 Tax=uncultured Marivita sp. TaxID=888080 RepID=UPI0026259746|nr:LOG family protein [uncultured Marivita sp.]